MKSDDPVMVIQFNLKPKLRVTGVGKFLKGCNGKEMSKERYGEMEIKIQIKDIGRNKGGAFLFGSSC